MNRKITLPHSALTHTDLMRAMGKISAYLRVNNEEEAKKWVIILIAQLTQLGLYEKET